MGMKYQNLCPAMSGCHPFIPNEKTILLYNALSLNFLNGSMIEGRITFITTTSSNKAAREEIGSKQRRKLIIGILLHRKRGNVLKKLRLEYWRISLN